MLMKILSLLSAAAIAVTSFVSTNRKPIDYDSSIVNAYNEKLLENTSLPFSTGVNTNGLEGDGIFTKTMRELSNKETFDNITRQGFDHIRIPINFCLFYDDEKDELIQSEMAKLDNIMKLAEESGLYVMLDFHGWWFLNENGEADRKKFVRIWELVAEHYKNLPESFWFELVNEPNIKHLSAAKLNEYQAQAIEVIRKSNPTRKIICAAPDGNQPWLLKDLRLPEGDENLVVAVHIYHPGDFTHQGFEWSSPHRKRGVQVRLTDEMMDELMWNLNETKKFMDETGLPVVLNEFGMNLELAHKDDIDKYLSTITSFCLENGIPWAMWDYSNGEMALCKNNQWRTSVMDALFLAEK